VLRSIPIITDRRGGPVQCDLLRSVRSLRKDGPVRFSVTCFNRYRSLLIDGPVRFSVTCLDRYRSLLIDGPIRFSVTCLDRYRSLLIDGPVRFSVTCLDRYRSSKIQTGPISDFVVNTQYCHTFIYSSQITEINGSQSRARVPLLKQLEQITSHHHLSFKRCPSDTIMSQGKDR
jgi:hypothetical protein